MGRHPKIRVYETKETQFYETSFSTSKNYNVFYSSNNIYLIFFYVYLNIYCIFII